MNKMIMALLLLKIISWLLIGIFTPEPSDIKLRINAARIAVPSIQQVDTSAVDVVTLSVDR